MLRSLLFTLLCSITSIIFAQDTLLLFHPTAYNIALIEKLHNENILDLEAYHVLGVYHSLEAYNYEDAARILEESPDSKISIQEITENLEPGMLFGNNPCSGLFAELFRKSKGALFMGGPDIPPDIYGEPVHLLTSVTDPYRHYLEASFIFHLLGGSQDSSWEAWMNSRNNYLISGICLGMQTMNVATGGTMIQDIPTEVYGIWTAEELLEMETDQMHRNYTGMIEHSCESPTSYHFHQVSLNEQSFLRKIQDDVSQSPPLVLSSHHQAIQSPGQGWIVAATSMDGKIIEAIQHERFPHVFGVQFHPEKPGLFDPNIVYAQSCNKEISFNEKIRDTDSFSFHKAYWKYIEDILKIN